MTDRAEIGVIGGSGLYALLDDPHPVEVETPYGPPSAQVVLGTVAGRRVAFRQVPPADVVRSLLELVGAR